MTRLGSFTRVLKIRLISAELESNVDGLLGFSIYDWLVDH